jgi:hypothetical protein
MRHESRLRRLEERAAGHAQDACVDWREVERLRKLPHAELLRLHREAIGEPDEWHVRRLARLPVDALLWLRRASLAPDADLKALEKEAFRIFEVPS